MDIIIALAFFGIGLGLIIFFAEQLVKREVGTSQGFGLSSFLLIPTGFSGMLGRCLASPQACMPARRPWQ